mmetsp:Transcript_28139/g.24888  ORF Transcript_28139/g.24888 Transcript_28139/m.24888 type:complete len:251 (-) Transcript_28139:667-1419(-)
MMKSSSTHMILKVGVSTSFEEGFSIVKLAFLDANNEGTQSSIIGNIELGSSLSESTQEIEFIKSDGLEGRVFLLNISNVGVSLMVEEDLQKINTVLSVAKLFMTVVNESMEWSSLEIILLIDIDASIAQNELKQLLVGVSSNQMEGILETLFDIVDILVASLLLLLVVVIAAPASAETVASKEATTTEFTPEATTIMVVMLLILFTLLLGNFFEQSLLELVILGRFGLVSEFFLLLNDIFDLGTQFDEFL